MSFIKDITGQKFNRWTVIEMVDSEKQGAHFLCECECGNIKIIQGGYVRLGKTKSCGCLRNEINHHRMKTHGHSRKSERHIWSGMLKRCYDPHNDSFEHYGAKGIIVCDSWHEYENFINDMGNRPSTRHSLDRIDTNGNYDPKNCRWSDIFEQNRNKNLGKNNTSGHVGVSWVKSRNKWVVMIGRKNIGLYTDKDDAINARKEAERKYWNRQ